MPKGPFPKVAGMGFFYDEVSGASTLGITPQLGFVPLQEGGYHFHRAVKGVGEGRLRRRHKRPSAIGITAIVYLAGADNQAGFPPRVTPNSGHDQKK